MMVSSKYIPSYHAIRQLCLLCFILFFHTTAALSQQVVSITINDEGINPASAEFIDQAINTAQRQKAECLVINLNTPGGLITSTRQIVSKIMQAEVPVVVYVSPEGAHAGSAGVFITMAAHIAAMAPGTNIGAAHPVSLQGRPGDVMNEKETNDAAAFIRTIAERRNRNSEWAEEAVRQSVALTEKEALENKVIDLVADNELRLLAQIDGKQILLGSGVKTMHTKNAKVQIIEMGFFQKILDRICDPTVAYILMMLGFFGLLFELFNPGAIFPGIVGVIFLVFAFYAMSSLQVNYAGVTLIVFGILLFLLEIKIVSHGLLSFGGIISLLLGSMFLFRSSPLQNIVTISWSVIITTTLAAAMFFLFIVGMGLKAQRYKPVTGNNDLIGKTALTLVELNPSGQVSFKGEIWNAVTLSHHIKENKEVIIKSIKALTLFVEQAGEPDT